MIQYPAERTSYYTTEVLRFVDGTEQRFRQSGSCLRRWVVRLDLLSEEELHTLWAFVGSAKGRQGTFTFRDPWDGRDYPTCGFEDDDLEIDFEGELRGKTMVTIREKL